MKKRVLSLLTTLALVVGLTVFLPTISASAYYTSGDYDYEILEDGTVEITDYDGSATSLTIPSKIDGYDVTIIGFESFAGCKSLVNVVIPSSVTDIYCYAFSSCSNLTNVTISETVTSIDDSSFNNCENLLNINVSSNNKNYSSVDGVLYNKEVKTLVRCPYTKSSVSIPNSVITIGNSAFKGCDKLVSIEIPESVTSFGDYAFFSCDNLTKVNIPDTVVSIGTQAFSYCNSLKNITIPSSVKSIEYGAFGECNNLSCVTLLSGATTSISKYAFAWCKSLAKIIIPSTVTDIDSLAFLDCDNIAIYCYKNSAALTYAKNNNISYYILDNTVSAKSTYTSTSSAVRINWNKVAGATGYRIYRYNSTTKKWVKVTTIKNGSTTTYKQTGLKSGTTYKYKVKAYIKAGGVNYWGSASSAITTSTKPSTAKFTTASKTTTAICLNWKKVTGASGYQIQKYNSSTKKWSTVKTITSGSTLTYRISGLKKGTVYKYRIRAYRTVNGEKLSGAWSATKKVTTKS
ncbi:MAG: fibronectin type III domain-containing protein [Ruminococcus sp.]|nr:fibronectin type III domain-containing protein [Ruminococcus sp.]